MAIGAPITFEVDVDALTNDKFGTAPLAKLVEIVHGAVNAVAENAAKRDLLKMAVKRVTIAFAPTRRVTLAGGALTIAVPTPGSGFGFMEREGLAAAIEKAL